MTRTPLGDCPSVSLQGNCVTTTKHFSELTGTTTSSISQSYQTPYVVKTTVFEDRIEIIYRANPVFSFTFMNAKPEPMVWKEVFRAKEDKIVRQIVYGKYVPTCTIPESYEFDEE